MSKAKNLINRSDPDNDYGQKVIGKSSHKLSIVSADSRPEILSDVMHHDVIAIDDLYGAPEVLSPDLSNALKLLAIALERVEESLRAIKEKDKIAADDSMQHLRALLPELFCCRTLGDGFGEIINALICSFENLQGQPLNEEQIVSIGQRLRRLRSEPFIKFSDAIDEVELLEKHGLKVTPAEFKYLADWLNGESFS